MRPPHATSPPPREPVEAPAAPEGPAGPEPAAAAEPPAALEAASVSDFPRVDELFAGEPPPPPREAAATLRRLRAVLLFAIPLDALGIFCWTGVPGAALTLYAYLASDAEMAHIEAGEYSPDDAAALSRLRSISTFFLYFSVVSFIIQTTLFARGFYNDYADLIARGVMRLWDLFGGGA